MYRWINKCQMLERWANYSGKLVHRMNQILFIQAGSKRRFQISHALTITVCYFAHWLQSMNQTQRSGFDSVRFVQSDSSVRFGFGCQTLWVRSVRNGLKAGFEFGVFGSGSVRFPSLVYLPSCRHHHPWPVPNYTAWWQEAHRCK